MKKLLISVLLSVMLLSVMVVPAMAAEDETSVGASVSVNEVVSITLTDAGSSGIRFAGGVPPITEQGDSDQSDGTPAIQVVVQSETNVNVDIAVKGAATGSLALANWKYSKAYADTPESIPAAYGTADYSNVGPGNYDYYHWIDVPEGTPSGSQGCTVSYKAITTGGTF